jgi:hypothetical protein
MELLMSTNVNSSPASSPEGSNRVNQNYGGTIQQNNRP